MKRQWLSGVVLLAFLFPLACQKTYIASPTSVVVLTWTPTSTITNTPTNTTTKTATPTITNTPTITSTPTNSATPTITFTPTLTPTITNTPTPPPNMIDDMKEDGSGGYQIYELQGRNGYWSDFTDSLTTGSNVSPVTTGTFTMSSPGYSGSNYCARMTGTVGTVSGSSYPFVGMGFGFLNPQAGYSIPASYTGIAFAMKATFSGPCTTPSVDIKIADATTNPSGDTNRVRVVLTPGVWTPVTIFFNQMLTEDYSGGVTETHELDTTTAYSVYWLVNYPSAGFDISVGQVQFITTTAPNPAAPLPGSSAWPMSLIDNCEKDYNAILLNQGRNGNWYNYDNSAVDSICPSTSNGFIESALASNPDGETTQTSFAAAITGVMGTGGWPGVGLMFLAQSGGYDQTYDIQTSPGGPYTGVQFWAMSGTGTASIAVQMGDASTDPRISGATCTTACQSWCQEVISISGSWAQYQVPFLSMYGQAWGGNQNTTVDPTTATTLQWTMVNQGTFGLSIDDVSFY